MSREEIHSFGDWLRRQRKARDWSQAALAQRVGCTAAMIRKIEAGERKPSAELAALLAEALAVPVESRTLFLQVARQLRPVAQLLSPRTMPILAGPYPALSTPANNLPAPLTSLVNRVHDAATVARLLTAADLRLLTLLGPPGIGKTRLAIHTAEQVATHFRDGVWFVDLAPLNDAALVLPAIAQVLAVAEAGATPLLERLRAVLMGKQLLFILDNCEQVSAAAPEIGALLRGCKGLKVLATSRTPLLLAGEHEYALPSLSLPPRDLVPTIAPAQLLTYEAVQLFVARVRQFQRDFAVSAANAPEIATICSRLDGLPLALELAAAALRHMTVSQLCTVLQSEGTWLHLLHSPARDLPARQRTLYQAIAWSYSLLDGNEQRIFRQLGVFVGGFTSAAVQAVCDAGPATLERLTEHNLLARRAERWQMLEMIREFALAHLSSAEHSMVRQKHIAYFAAQADQTLAVSLAAIAQDHDNFRAALTAAIAAQDADAAFTLCIKLVWFWELRGHLRDGVRFVRAALALPAITQSQLRFDLLERMATLAFQVHQFDVATEFATELHTLAYKHNDPFDMARLLNLQGRILIEQGELARAAVVLQENEQIARRIPHRFNPGCPLAQLGEIALMHGDWQNAERQLREALALLTGAAGTLYTGIFVAMTYTDLAELALVHGDPLQARYALQQVAPYAHQYVRRLHCFLVTLVGLLLTPLPTTPTAKTHAAAMFLGAMAGLGERTGDTLSPFHQWLIAERTAHVQWLLPPHDWHTAWQQGHAWLPAQAAEAVEQWLMGDVI
ncbi:MAG: helix-turn-helix domain-containing protein [Caldilineaceae bacterium]